MSDTQLLSFVGESARLYKSMTENEAYSYIEELSNISEGTLNIYRNNIRALREEAEYELDSIQCNFTSFITESDDMNETKEDKLKAIEDKKSSMVKSFRDRIFENENSIKRISAKANNEAINIISADRKTFKTFLSALRNKNNLEGFKGIKDFVFPGDKFEDCTKLVIDSTDTVVNLHRKYMNYLLQASSLEALKRYYKLYDEEMMAEIEDKIDTKLNADLKIKTSRWTPTMKDLSFMIRFVNNPSSITCSIADGCRHALANLTRLTSNSEILFRKVQVESDLDSIRLNYMYRCTSLANRKIGSIFYQYKDLTIREIAAYRKSVMITGRYANDKKNKKQRSVKEWAIMEDVMSSASDLYVFDKLSGPSFNSTMNNIIESDTAIMSETINIMVDKIITYFREESEGMQSKINYFEELKEALNRGQENTSKFFEDEIQRFSKEIDDSKCRFFINPPMVHNMDKDHVLGYVHSYNRLGNVKPSERCVNIIAQMCHIFENLNKDQISGNRACELISRDMLKNISGMETRSMEDIDEHYKEYLTGHIVKVDKCWLERNLDKVTRVISGDELIKVLKEMEYMEKLIRAGAQYAIEHSMDHEDISNTLNISHYSLITSCMNTMHKCNAIILDVYYRQLVEYKNIVSRLNHYCSESSEAQGTAEDNTSRFDMKPAELAKSAQNNDSVDPTEPQNNIAKSVQEAGLDDLKQKVANMGDKVSQIGTAFQNIKAKAADAAHKVIDAAVGNNNPNSPNGSIASKAVDFIKGAKEKVSGFVNNVRDKVADKVSGVKDFITDKIDIMNNN